MTNVVRRSARARAARAKSHDQRNVIVGGARGDALRQAALAGKFKSVQEKPDAR